MKYINVTKLDLIKIIKSEIIDRKDITLDDLSMLDVKILRDAASKIERTLEEYNSPLLSIYPNKFKIISNTDQIDDDGIYYINSMMPEDLIYPLSDWISEVFKNKYIIPAGFIRGSISYSDFYNKYNYDIKNFNYELNNTLVEMDLYGTYYINPIRFIDNKIVLWGEVIRGCNIENLQLTITNAAVLMNVLNMFIEKGIESMDRYLLKLTRCGIIYGFSNWHEETYIQFSKSIDPYILNTENIENVKRDLNYLKKCLIKGDF